MRIDEISAIVVDEAGATFDAAHDGDGLADEFLPIGQAFADRHRFHDRPGLVGNQGPFCDLPYLKHNPANIDILFSERFIQKHSARKESLQFTFEQVSARGYAIEGE